jgi:hypothetical protein
VAARFDDPQTTEAAAANPNLPIDLMGRILRRRGRPSERPDDTAIIMGGRSRSFMPVTDP